MGGGTGTFNYPVRSDGILLTLLQKKSYMENRSVFPLREVVRELKELEESSSEISMYNFVEADPTRNPRFRRDLENLKIFRFVDYDFQNHTIEITAVGRLFGETFNIPPVIERYLSEKMSARKIS